MSWTPVDALKQQISLLDYLQAQHWKPARRTAGGRVMGLCPLHADHRPSFLVDPHKNLFYCYGCGHGGDLIRFAELYHGARISSRRGHRVSASARDTSAGSHRGVRHRLRSGPMPAPLVDDFGLFTPRSPAGRSGERGRTRHLLSSHRVSACRQPIWAQYRTCGTPPVSPRRQRRLVSLGESTAVSRDHSGGGDIRSHRAVAGGISQCHLRAGETPERAAGPTVVRGP